MTTLSQKYEDRILQLLFWQNRWPGPGITRQYMIALYLARRAWRPVYASLKADYEKIWGKKCSYSYFFHDQYHRMSWINAWQRFKAANK